MKKKHIVIGDLILDRFIYGHVERISPEAPSLVLDVDHQVDIFGGANNVAAHLCGLGHECHLITAVGEEFDSDISLFKAKFRSGITTHLIPEHGRKTTIKTRLVSIYKHSHLLRFDIESTHAIERKTEDLVFRTLKSLIADVETILLVDYNKGMITTRLAKKIIELARYNNKLVFVDTKCDDLTKFSGATLIKPNKREFEKILLRHSLGGDAPVASYRLLNNLKIGCIVKTAGDEGIYAYTNNYEELHVKGEKVEVKELSGAGDSVLAVLSYCLSTGYSLQKSLECANQIASKFVSNGAGYTASLDDMDNK